MKKVHKPLRIINYDDHILHNPTYEERLSSTSSIVTNLEIYPFSPKKQTRVTKTKLPLFIVAIPDMLPLMETIYKNSKTLESLGMQLPAIVHEQQLRHLIIEEIQSTNEIEGVKSTRSEINDAFEAQNKEEVRFGGIVHLYHTMLRNEKIEISQLKDFRTIYDELVLDEIDDQDKPDGELFRLESVYIQDSNKKFHQGDPTEAIIQENLTKLIQFMNLDDLSYLFKTIITHYFFEYIHPFYDGNGRMGRFLLSRYLARKIDVYTGMSFSQGVFMNKALYEKSFSEVSHPRNNGELTYFVIDMMKIIIDGQNKIITEMKLLQKQLNRAEDYINQFKWDAKKSRILEIFLQHSFYQSFDSGVTSSRLSETLLPEGYTRYTIDKITTELVEEGFIEKIGKSPVKHILNEDIAALFE